MGKAIQTGAGLVDTSNDNPVKRAYELFNNLNNRSSWDQTAVLAAIRDPLRYWAVEDSGYCQVFSDGSNIWKSSPDLEHAYLKIQMPRSEVADEIEALMVHTPGKPFAVISQNRDGVTVHFDGGASIGGNAQLIGYAWDFGDGSTGTNESISHAYASPGVYTAALTVTNSLGISAQVTARVTIPVSVHGMIGEYGTVTVTQQNSSSWYTENFQGVYADPVVVMGPVSYAGGDPSTIRVRKVGPTGFEYQLDEWDYKDGAHITETTGYIVLESGSHTLIDGTRLEAGTYSGNHDWSQVTFGTPFGSTPVTLSQTLSFDGSSAVVTRQKHITTGSFDLRLQEEQGTDGIHAFEIVGWVAIEPGPGSAGTLDFEIGTTPNTVTSDWYPFNFSSSYFDPPIFLAGMQSCNGSDPAALRYRNLTGSGVEVFCEEEKSADNEIDHVPEVVGWLAFSEPGVILVSPPVNQPPMAIDESVETDVDVPVAITLRGTDPENSPLLFAIDMPPLSGVLSGTEPDLTYTPEPGFIGFDSFTFRVTDDRGLSATGTVSIEVTDGGSAVVIGESGTVAVTQEGASSWYLVELSGSYIDPVVVMGPPTFNGGNPSAMRVRNVTAVSFEFQLDEWDYQDGGHLEETVGYLVMEAGVHTLSDGTIVKAGSLSVHHEWASVGLAGGFTDAPVVVSQCVTYNGSSAVTTRQQNVSALGFEVKLQEEQDNDGTHAVETVAWIAMESGGGTALESGVTPNAVTHGWYTIQLQQSYAQPPVFMAAMQGYNGPDPAAMRCRNLLRGSAEVFVEEEKSADTEVNHVTEAVGWIALAAGMITD